MGYKADCGYLIAAFNNNSADYIACAETLALSLRKWHPAAKICLVTDEEYQNPVFDFVEYLKTPSKLDWKVDLDAHLYKVTPFHETVKIEADCVVASPIDHWWKLFRNFDVWVSSGARDFQNKVARSRKYRKIFDDNLLPDVYNAVTYWRASRLSVEFFELVNTIFENWSVVQQTLKYAKDHPPNTDLAYAIAIDILGRERFTSPRIGPLIVHMKSAINQLIADDWSEQLVWEIADRQFRINGFAQNGILHYNKKHLATKFRQCYE